VLCSTIIAVIQNKVQDNLLATDARCIALFNDCMSKLAADFLLPELATWDELVFEIGEASTETPADFHRQLSMCYNQTAAREVLVERSLAAFQALDPAGTRTGSICRVFPFQQEVACYPIPTAAETIKAWYFRHPSELTASDDVIDGLPDDLAKDALADYALRELFDEIEDDVTGKKPNTLYFTQRFERDLQRISRYVNFSGAKTVQATSFRP